MVFTGILTLDDPREAVLGISQARRYLIRLQTRRRMRSGHGDVKTSLAGNMHLNGQTGETGPLHICAQGDARALSGEPARHLTR